VALLSRKYRPAAVPVALPSMSRISLPDVQVMGKHHKRIQMTNDVAMDEAQSPEVREFARELGIGLDEVLAPGALGPAPDREAADRFTGVIGVSVCLGLGYSAVDDGLGIPKGLSDQCTHTALAMGSLVLADFPESWGLPVNFAMMAGHFMGRCGRSTMPALLEAAGR
jgi:hypothetical protein